MTDSLYAGKVVRLRADVAVWRAENNPNHVAWLLQVQQPSSTVVMLYLDRDRASVWTRKRNGYYVNGIVKINFAPMLSLRAREIAVYDKLVEHGVLDPLVAVLL